MVLNFSMIWLNYFTKGLDEMKKWKRAAAVTMSVCLCGVMTACGKTDYYDKLEKEYKKTGMTSCTFFNEIYTMPVGMSYREYAVLYDDSIILSLNDHDQQKVFVYDTKDKEVTATIDHTATNTTSEGPLFCKGYIYNITTEFTDDYEQERTLNKIDLNGKITASRSITEKDENGLDAVYLSLKYVTQDGKVIMEDGSGARLMLDEDLDDPKVLSNPDKGLFLDPVADYEDNVLCRVDNGEYYWLDIGNMEWEQADSDFINAQSMAQVKCVGKYFLGTDFVYDMKAMEAVTEKLSTSCFAGSYVGGDISLSADLDKYTWYSLQFPDDGSETDKSDLKKLGDLDKEHYNFNIVPIDAKRYVICDDLGAYLTTYDNGKKDIETIVKF